MAQSSLGDLATFNQPGAQQDFINSNPVYQSVDEFGRDVTSPELSGYLNPLVNFDPMANNPIYDATIDEERRRVTENRAARGKLGSGGTLVDLTNATARTRNDLANQEYNRLFQTAGAQINTAQSEFGNDFAVEDTAFNDLLSKAALNSGLSTDQFNKLLATVSTSQNAATGQANVAQALGSNVGNIQLGQGNAEASGIIGSSNALLSFFKDAAHLATGTGAFSRPPSTAGAK